MACLAVGGAMAGGASGAAAQVPAAFSTVGAVEQSGSLTFEVDGGSPLTCHGVEIEGSSSGSIWLSYGWQAFDCEGGTSAALIGFIQYPYDDGGAYFVEGGMSGGLAPQGGGFEGGFAFRGPVVNAAGGPTTVTFTDAVVGYRESDSAEVTVTGTLELTDQFGAPVTVQ